VVLRSDARLVGGAESFARVEVPGSWSQTVDRPERAELLGADNFSRITVTLSPVIADASTCAQHAARIAEEEPAPHGTRKLTAHPDSPDVVDYLLTVPSPVPGPSDRVVLGRAICRNGGLANVTCSTGYLKAETLERCEKVVASLSVDNASPPVTRAPPPQKPLPPEVAPPAEQAK
jgi:hypothetical protein